MSFIRIPDPHPGRCQNYRNVIHSDGYPETLRCLDYEYGEHVCRFPLATHLVITDRNAIYSQDSTRSRPSQPWVAPWDVDDLCHIPNCRKGPEPHVMHNAAWEGPRITAYRERLAAEDNDGDGT